MIGAFEISIQLHYELLALPFCCGSVRPSIADVFGGVFHVAWNIVEAADRSLSIATVDGIIIRFKKI